MIKSFGDKRTERLFNGERALGLPPDVVRIAYRKLDIINRATILSDLLAPPGNRLEALRGNLKGFHSIRINNQWRITFRWETPHAHEVQVVDDH